MKEERDREGATQIPSVRERIDRERERGRRKERRERRERRERERQEQ